MDLLSLYQPTQDELDYRGLLISDEETMAYNMGYGDQGGCTYHKTSEQLREWYQGWNDSEHFYAYLCRNEDHTFIGEVNLHKNTAKDWYEMGIVIEAKYRGQGYSVPALKLLLNYAFETMQVNAVHNYFERSRVSAAKMHRAADFAETLYENGMLEFLLTREQYQRNKDGKESRMNWEVWNHS